jgi:hypothetical protein
VTADALLDPVLSAAILQGAQATGSAITGLKGFADGEPIQLGWAEVRLALISGEDSNWEGFKVGRRLGPFPSGTGFVVGRRLVKGSR